MSYSDAFFLDLAVGVMPFEQLCFIHGHDAAAVAGDQSTPDFQIRLAKATQAVEDTGQAFRARCRQLATDNLPTIVHMIGDADVASSVRLEAWKTLTKLGSLEAPKQDVSTLMGPQLILNIMAPDGSLGYTAEIAVPQPPVELLERDE